MAKRLQTFFGQLGSGELGYMGKWIGMATLIGVGGGLAAVGFDHLVDLLKANALARAIELETEGLGQVGASLGLLQAFADNWPLFFILPLAGLLVGWITYKWAPESEGHGTEQLIRTFHDLGGAVRKRVIFIKALTSAITIGSGGSAGQEGPVAQVGSGIGSTASKAMGLGDRDRRIFLLAGASAGIGALFTAPLAGALFAPEVLYRKPEFEGDAIIPCIISSIVGYTTFTSITGETKAIHISSEVLGTLTQGDPRELLLYLGLALLCTIASLFYVRTFNGIHGAFNRMNWLWKPARPALGGLLLAFLAVFLAPLTGEFGVLYGGYDLMTGSIGGQLAISTMAILVVGKALATSLSIATGGSGGVFAPSLAMGALLGGIVGQIGAQYFPSLGISPASFALVGMGGFFAGVAKTPIAAIIIVCEMTGSYGLLLPLMLVSVIHLILARGWGIYDTQVNGPADSPAHFGDFVVDVLEKMKVGEVIDYTSEVAMVSQNSTLRRALEVVAGESASYFPVVDNDKRLVGIFSLSDIRRIFQEVDVQDLVIVRDFMVEEVATVKPEDSLDDALRLMNQYTIHEMPVVSAADPRHVVALLTRNNLAAAYHQRLRDLRRS
ncbi:MAG: chloride channel protein [Planctomycetota bacterium]|nr:chloride channel protein [Planctomycetota bacterium]MDG2142814.1 chloride channel protein [Planctomycetota bacterium]